MSHKANDLYCEHKKEMQDEKYPYKALEKQIQEVIDETAPDRLAKHITDFVWERGIRKN